jgi:hypothetical protein
MPTAPCVLIGAAFAIFTALQLKKNADRNRFPRNRKTGPIQRPAQLLEDVVATSSFPRR